MTGGNSDLKAPLFRCMLCAGALEGSFYVAYDSESSDEIRSIGVYFGPGVYMFSSGAQRAQGWNDLFAPLSRDTQDWWTGVVSAR